MFALADSVFMPNEAERTEYVLNDTGYLYVGSVKNIRERPWNFGQVKYAFFSSFLTLDISKHCYLVKINVNMNGPFFLPKANIRAAQVIPNSWSSL